MQREGIGDGKGLKLEEEIAKGYGGEDVWCKELWKGEILDERERCRYSKGDRNGKGGVEG